MIEKLADAKELDGLFDDWLADTDTERYGIFTDKAIATANFQLFCDMDTADVLVSRSDGRIVGMLVMLCDANAIGPGVIAAERFFYVSPKYRGIAGIRLMKAGEQWARDRGCTHLVMGSSKVAGDMFDKVCDLYERFGMTHIESSYIKEL